MRAYECFQLWAKEGFSIDIPKPDDSGLSRFTVEDTYCVHIFANPKPGAVNSIFIYIPIVNLQGLHIEQELAALWYIVSTNMPATLPTGFQIGSKKDNGFAWLCGEFDITSMRKVDFENCVQRAISLARTHKTQLTECIVQAYNSGSRINEDFSAIDMTHAIFV